MAKAPMARANDGKLGAFLGVYLPTALTILGVIMYLRFGWVLGQMGLARTLLIVLLANAITLITTLSFSAIATNIRVGVGGAYYIISRSLGLEMGGAIGLPLFLSQAFSVTLYAFGLAESLLFIWPEAPVQLCALVIVGLVGALAMRGAQLALKAQVPLLVLIAVSLVALVAGAATREPVQAVVQTVPLVGFWAVFAIFFPAVTGVMAGLGLSGDLRDPVKAIPRGALLATLTGLAVYLAVPLVLGMGASPAALRQDPLIWTSIALLGAWLVLPGLWGAIFSSAVGSVLGAPRTLQALARDRLAPAFLGRLSGKRQEPVIGLLLTLAIAMGAVLLGDLNAVALVVSMFFLTVYGMVNLVAALETLSGDTSWRPQLRVHWGVCLLGAIGCFSVMFLISPPAAIAALVTELALWGFLTRREQRAGWGDARRGIYESLIRWSLIRLARRPMTPRNWRPHILVFVANVDKTLDLIRFGTWFAQGRGVVSVCELVVGDLLKGDVDVSEREKYVQKTMTREGLIAFGEVDVVRHIISGITDVAQANGIAGMDSNTMLMGLPSDSERIVEFFEVVERLEQLNKSVILGRLQPGFIPRPGEKRTIHVWWGGMQRNGDLMLLLAHLLTRNPEWRDSQIRVLSIASNEHMRQQTEDYLNKLIPEIRIHAKATVMSAPKDQTVRDIIHRESAAADIVFLGLTIPPGDERAAYAERVKELAAPLKTVFFVKNSTLFVGKLVQTVEQVARQEITAADEAVGPEPVPDGPRVSS